MTQTDMSALPEPLVPTHVELKDFRYMPLLAQRLRDSKMVSSVSAEEFRSAVLLWAAAWHQTPAGSLPDDDGELAQLAGYGFVLRAWKKVRKGALRGYVKCSDGRLYHPVAAELVMEAWDTKLAGIWRKECDRLRKENKKRREDRRKELPIPTFDEWKSAGMPSEQMELSDGKDAISDGPSDGIPTENALKGIEGKGKEEKERKNSSLPTAAANPGQGARGSGRAAAPPLGEGGGVAEGVALIDTFDRLVLGAWPEAGRRRHAASDPAVAAELAAAGFDVPSFEAFADPWLAAWVERRKPPAGSLELVRADALAWLAARNRPAPVAAIPVAAPKPGPALGLGYDLAEAERRADEMAARARGAA